MSLAGAFLPRRLRKLARTRLTRPHVEGAAAFSLTHRLASGVEVRVSNDSDWYVFNEVFVDGEYDEAIRDTFAKPSRSSGTTVLDLGANVGFFALRVLDLYLQTGARQPLDLFLVEGSPATYARLVGEVGSQSLPNVRIVPVHGLAGARAGSATLAEIPFGARNTLFPHHNAQIMEPSLMTQVQVPFIDLDELMGSRHVDLLKCDVEGAEGLVAETYADSLLRRCSRAVFEVHPHLCDMSRFFERLGAACLVPSEPVEAIHGTQLVHCLGEAT